MVDFSWKSITHPVINSTPGDTKPLPYANLQGSDQGVDDTINDNAAEQIWPTYTTATAPVTQLPSNFTLSTSVQFDVFSKWHSQVQAYWMDKNNLTTATLTDSKNVQHSVVRSTETARVWTVDQLSKRDFASMSLIDQERIAATPYFLNTLAGLYNLLPSNATGSPANTVANARTTVAAVIQAAQDKINSQWAPHGADTDRDVFKAEITNIEKRLATMGIFSLSDIQTKIDEITERSNRAQTFKSAINTESFFYNGLHYYDYKQPISFDNGATIKSGYDSFMANERRILALDNARMDLAAKKGDFADRRLDAPTLIFLFQQYTNQIVEADVAAKTEEINQLNAWLKTVSVIQKLVGQTVASFDPSQNNEKRGWLDKANSTDKKADKFKYVTVNGVFPNDEEYKAMAMAEDFLGKYRKHPIAELYGIALPTLDFIQNAKNFNRGNGETQLEGEYLTLFKPKWDSYATSLSDMVTLLNQESQVKMNDVNSAEKQKNRHFELANNALSKMYDILQNVARSG